MADPKVVVVDERSDNIEVPSAVPERPQQIIVPLKAGEGPWSGDILVLLAPAKSKLKYGQRMSVRPQQDKCICKGRGWGVVEQDDGSRFHRRAPGLCKCIGQAIARICGAEAVIASWAPPAGDPVLEEWRAVLVAKEEAAATELSGIRTERECQAHDAEAEAARVEALAVASEPEAAEAARALSAARDAVAGAVTAEGQAKAILVDAEKTLKRARAVLATAEASHAVAAHKVNREGAARLRATAAILRGPKGAWADKERRAVAALERVRREMGVVVGLGVVGAVQASAPVLAGSLSSPTKDIVP